MMFEFYNPGPSDMDHTMHRPFGVVRIGRGESVPTVEQETQGLIAEFFEDLVPSLLCLTPPALRRRLLEEQGIEVPSDLISCTGHLAEFQQSPAQGGESEPIAADAAHGDSSEADKCGADGARPPGGPQAATSEVREGAEVASEELPDAAAAPTDETLPSFIDAIVALLSRHPGGQWSGKCGELLGELGRNGRATAKVKWPKAPQQLGTALRRHKEDLERLGIELSFRREGKSSTRVVTLRRRVELPTDGQRNPVPELER